MKEREFARLVLNAMLMSRGAAVNQSINPEGRDIDRECGYPIGEQGADYYWTLYQSVGIGNRVVGVYPSESWSVYPEMYEVEEDNTTKFEERWNKINKHGAVWSMLDRIDELSGIGNYGVLFLGFADGGNLTSPVPGVGENGLPDGKRAENELLFMRAYDQSNVEIVRYESDFRNPRYGQPTEYKLNVSNPVAASTAEGKGQTTTKQSLNVHWSRILHVADNRKSSEVFGLPRMRPVLPEIMDIRKIRGGSAEMFWQGAFPGLSIESDPDVGTDIEPDKESIKEEFELYRNHLQRYMAFIGMKVKSLAPQVASPSDHLAEQYSSISATLGVPLRVLLGAESGHLASTQDQGTWNRRLKKRQDVYVTPHIVAPFVDRMMMAGVLPQVDNYFLSWNDLNTLTAADKADIALKRTQCLMSYATGGVEQIMPVMEYYIHILGLSIEEAKAILRRAMRKNRKMLTAATMGQGPEPQGGGRNGGDQQGEQGNTGTRPDGERKEKLV